MNKKSKRKTNQLVYFELHVDDRTFYVHGIVEASSQQEALDTLKSIKGKHFNLQIKAALGKATLRNVTWALKDAVPEDSVINPV